LHMCCSEICVELCCKIHWAANRPASFSHFF
jgi:hypothetical protein